jgi:hypothetical protein
MFSYINNKYCFGVGIVIIQVECFVLELVPLCSQLNALFWSCRLYVPRWMFCCGVGICMFLVDCFVLELASICSWLIALFWSWRLYAPGWLFCFGVGVLMFLVDFFVLEFCVIRYVVMPFIYKLVVLVLCCVSTGDLFCLYWVSEFVLLFTFLCNGFCVSRFVFRCTIPCYCSCTSRFWFLCTVPFSILHGRRGLAMIWSHILPVLWIFQIWGRQATYAPLDAHGADKLCIYTDM